MWPVFVLLWKHTLVRGRSIAAVCEFIVPLIMVIVLHFMAKISVNKKNTMEFSNEELHQNSGSVLYSPESELTDRLMHEVGAKLNLKRLDHLPSEKERGYFPFSRDSSLTMMKYSRDNMSSEDAIVIFENMESYPWPGTLNYTIRMKTDFMTQLEPYDTYKHESLNMFNVGTYENFGMRAFLRLQWAIDTSYLQLTTRAQVDQTLALQEFPFSTDTTPWFVFILASIILPLAIIGPIVSFTRRLFEEKISGLHELQKISGVSAETIALSHVLDMLSVLLVYMLAFILYFKLAGHLLHTSGGYLAFAMALYFCSIMAFSFIVFYLLDISSAQTVEMLMFCIMFGFVIIIMATIHLQSRTLSLLLYYIPLQAYSGFWMSLSYKEALGVGITISNMWSRDGLRKVSVGESYLSMAFQILLFSIISWYLSKVRPGKFGQPWPWNFPFKQEYWITRPQVETVQREVQTINTNDKQYFEKAPNDIPVGIQINNVYKSFGEEKVLHGVNLAVCRGEITVLLGHNGAGKTTLINIITGLIPASSGTVQIEGKDTVKQSVESRKLIGLCPQQNIFFDKLCVLEHVMFFAMVPFQYRLDNVDGRNTDLIPASSDTVLIDGKDTVKQSMEARKLIGLCPQQNSFFENLRVLEHFMFFAMLKGQSYSQSRASSTELLARLQLSDKLQEKPAALSGGMKRRVQLACAVAGGARVLVMDEPTSGLDVETRRELCDMLLSLRGEHTVLLTTHFMEEADALGDRIAALHHGRVRCHATPMFLKRAIGTGHRLTFTTLGAPNEAAITGTITAVVPDATVRDHRPNGLTYNLPAMDTARFPQLFATLEKTRSELQIDTIGVSRSTLDEVFLELCSDEKPTYEEKETPTREPALEKVTGCKLRAQQFVALLQRQCYFVKLRNFVIVVIFIGALICFLSLASNNPRRKITKSDTKALNLDLYAGRPQRLVLVTTDESTLQALRTAFEGVQFEEVPDVANAMLRTSRENMQEYKNYVVGIELNDTSAKALYSPSLPHAAPVALNALSNALAARLTRFAPLRSMSARTINVRNHPLRSAYVPYNEAKLLWPKQKEIILMWSSFMAMILCCFLSSFARLPSIERTTGTRHAYIIAGTPRWIHWTALYAGHVNFTLIIVLFIILFTFALDKDHTFRQPGFLLALFVVLMLSLLAMLGLVYFVSTLFSLTTTTTLLFILVMISTMFTSSVKESLKIMYIPYVLLPPHALTVGLLKTATVAQVNSHCSLNRVRCPELAGPGMFKAEKCCGSSPGSEPWSYWSVGDAAGGPILVLVFQAVAFFMLTYFSDNGMLGRLISSAPAPPKLRFKDAAVRAEAVYVENTIKLPTNQISDAVLGYKVKKSYSRCFKEPYHAVKGISFSVKKGECFGLLGVNGAGKSTTFKLLTSETAPTGGEIFANGYRSTERSKYMPTLSYCPQYGGVDGFLTGRQNLTLLLKLRGLKATDAAVMATSWIKEVDLLQHADKPVSSYSGGMARRLAAAAALCQAAETAVLDEPTAGVDPVARRQMHQALLRVRRQKSIIIASHSLDEMEALCHRIAIMSGGELRALGSAAALKIQHAQGYTIVFKLATENVNDDALEEFKERLYGRFDCELKDQHRNTLRYHVKTSLSYSMLFTQLEEHRAQFPELLKDYTVTDTTLEEVFLALAREAKEAKQSPPTV